MAAQRRSATKQRRRGRGAAAPAVKTAPAPSQAEPAAESKKQPAATATAGAKTASPKQQSAAPARVSKFRTTYERFRKGLQNTISEIKKVSWPDSDTTRNLTALVIAMSTVLGLLLGGIDFLLLKLFETF